MRVFLAILCLLHVSAKPLADKNSCPVNQVYKCGTEPCSCKNEKSEPMPWMKFLSAVIPGSSNRCECSKQCTRVVEVPCKRGTCDRKQGKCSCFPCWTGISCSLYSNKYSPTFPKPYEQLKVASSLNDSKVVGKVIATDADEKSCVAGLKCPCAEIQYQLIDGADETFEINEASGEIVLRSAPYKDDYILEIGATNTEISRDGNAMATIPDERKSSKMFMHVDTRDYAGEKIEIIHSRGRRSVSTGSLVLTVSAVMKGKFYFDIGEEINFVVSLKHNASLTAVSVSNVVIRVSSAFLTIQTAGKKITKTGSFTPTETLNNGILEISLTGASFASGNTYDGNFTTTVKNTIGPLSNLLLTAELNATTDIYIKQTSSPALYAVYPKVNLTRSSNSDVRVYGAKNFTMKITFPKLNYSLLAEITTNIESFIFMEMQNVVVKNMGSNVVYNGSAIPKYHSTLNNGVKDRVVIDFGFVKNNADTDNTVEITFTVKVLDHASLVNNTMHWIGVGLQAGYRVLWVEQQSFKIIKEEPTLALSVTSSNITTNSTNLYIGDELLINYSVNHTNTSTAAAINVKITCYFENLVAPASALATTLSAVNSTSVVVKQGGSLITNLPLGNILIGSFKLQLAANVTPFVAAKVRLNVAYENANLVAKKPVTAALAGSILAGTPSILMSLDSSNNSMAPGQKRKFTVVILLTKMKCPIRFELVMPTISNSSVFHILSVEKAIIGSNIQGLNQDAKPILKSSYSDGIDNVANYDLGIGINTNSDVSSTDSNKIKLSFEVMLTDHANATNGSSFWVGAGLVGKPNMIWVGQISMTTILPDDNRPRLSMKNSIILGTGSETYPDYKYFIGLKHTTDSYQSAYDVKVRFFLPDYVEFLRLQGNALPRVTHKKFGGSRLFEISGKFFFTNTFNITFWVKFTEANFPHTGKVYITTPIYLLYKNSAGRQFTLVNALHRFVDVPKEKIPTVTPVPEYYEKGFSWHSTGSNTYMLYVCSDSKAKRYISACYSTSDKGVTWHSVDSRVASVIGHDLTGNRYGISKDKLSYLTFDTDLKRWVSIAKSDFKPAANTVVKLTSGAASGDPSSSKTIATDHWGVSADGVFYKAGGTGAWVKKSIWL